MKKVIGVLGVILSLFGSAYASNEIVFVDLQELFKHFYKTQLAESQMKKMVDDMKSSQESIEEKIKEMKEEVEIFRSDSHDDALSEEARESARNKLEEQLVMLREKERDMIDFGKQRKEQIEKQYTRTTKSLLDEIQETVVRHAKAMGYTSVIDRSAKNRIGFDVILFTNRKADITATVLTLLNERWEQTKTEDTIKVNKK